jgi:hypothetical protein
MPPMTPVMSEQFSLAGAEGVATADPGRPGVKVLHGVPGTAHRQQLRGAYVGGTCMSGVVQGQTGCSWVQLDTRPPSFPQLGGQSGRPVAPIHAHAPLSRSPFPSADRDGRERCVFGPSAALCSGKRKYWYLQRVNGPPYPGSARGPLARARPQRRTPAAGGAVCSAWRASVAASGEGDAEGGGGARAQKWRSRWRWRPR